MDALMLNKCLNDIAKGRGDFNAIHIWCLRTLGEILRLC